MNALICGQNSIAAIPSIFFLIVGLYLAWAGIHYGIYRLLQGALDDSGLPGNSRARDADKSLENTSNPRRLAKNTSHAHLIWVEKPMSADKDHFISRSRTGGAKERKLPREPSPQHLLQHDASSHLCCANTRHLHRGSRAAAVVSWLQGEEFVGIACSVSDDFADEPAVAAPG